MDESLGKFQELAPVNSDPGGPAADLQGAQAEADCPGADVLQYKGCQNFHPEAPLFHCREQ